VLLVVDDDIAVLNAVQRDLRHEYGDRFRVLRADSGTVALDVLRELQLRNEPVALFMVDQRMPQMTGVEFLERAKELVPDAKRLLLTAYADTDAAIKAINAADVDYYLLKPWDPPEERLYPVVGDLLDDWLGHYRPPFEGIRIVGQKWSPEGHVVRDYLARNLVPYRWLDVESDAEARKLLEQAGVDDQRLPMLLFPDGQHLEKPSLRDVAGKLGILRSAGSDFYDLVIVGAGPTGLSAAVYGASEGLRTAIVERDAPGGQAAYSARIENYLGFPAGLGGDDLARRAVTQARRFGAEFLSPVEVVGMTVDGTYRAITFADSTRITCHSVLIATGVSYRRLDVPGVADLVGRGVYYGSAVSEATACRGLDVFVVGGGNSAGQAAVYLARFARSVTMLVRDVGLDATMSRYLIDAISRIENITVRPLSEVAEAHGRGNLEALSIRNKSSNQVETVPAASVFVFIGAQPRTDWLADSVLRDARGYVLTGADLKRDGKWPKEWTLDREPSILESSVPGVFVAGDVRYGSTKRIATGVGEGAIAVSLVHQYLKDV
jgi:thioredoxin reductase (NADPH)